MTRILAVAFVASALTFSLFRAAWAGPVEDANAAIEKYFADLHLKGSGNKNAIEERHSIMIDDSAVLVTGFYEFTRMKDGTPTPSPSRFTMLVTKRGSEWRIAHHHSSPRALPKP